MNICFARNNIDPKMQSGNPGQVMNLTITRFPADIKIKEASTGKC